MRIDSIQKQSCNNQSYKALKMTQKTQAVYDKVINNAQGSIKKVTKETKTSFWQKMKDAWNLVNKLQ